MTVRLHEWLRGWARGWQLMTSMQRSVFTMLVVCAAFSVLLPDPPELLRPAALGALGAWLVVRPRRPRRRLHADLLRAAAAKDEYLRRTPVPKALSDAERATKLRTAAWFSGRRMAEGTADRKAALEQMQNVVAGLPPERYAAELDGALARIEGHRMDIRRRRAELVTHARSLDALNAVFTVHYYNRRYSRHIGQYGLGPMDLPRVLDGAVQPQRIDEEIRRSDALIEDAFRMRGGSRDREIDLASLREGHPGFDDRALADALAWGGVINR